MKTAVQIDFDGTVTEEDVSFLLLDTFAGGDWRKYLDEYSSGDISVGKFNKIVFGMIKADEKTLTDFVLTSPRVKIRPGFKEMIAYCVKIGHRIMIVSNGLKFYIQALLKNLGVNGLEIRAAENIFSPRGMKVRYLGPDGQEVDAGFKEVYTDMLCQEGYQVIYVGNGTSDIHPSRKAQYVCATADLLERCRQEKLKCYPFNDFFDVIKAMETMGLGK
ncbi:MAG: HAD-IB family phosphatase [Dehalococcoidales bacterium]|jgi:2-hydroxy-3-keto-5-methylthiopentenyl-1-phosphate phosphatase